MSDQKPKLEYERPEPALKVSKMDFAMGVVLVTIGSVCVLAGAGWIWDFIRHRRIRDIIAGGYVAGPWLTPILGFCILFIGWRILRRR